jgi:hypothetical protein
MNYIYEQIQKFFITEEENLKNLINNFFCDYDDIIQEYKIIFILHLQKLDSENDTLMYEESLCHSKILLNPNHNVKLKKNKYKYIFTFNCENYKQQNKLFFVNIFIPSPSSSLINTNLKDSYGKLYSSAMIYQKYYYNIYLYENKIMNLIKEYKYNNKNYEEITLKSVVTEIIDIVIKT